MTERIANTIVVRGKTRPVAPDTPEGETRNNVPLDVIKKYSSPKPLFRPKTWKDRQASTEQ